MSADKPLLGRSLKKSASTAGPATDEVAHSSIAGGSVPSNIKPIGGLPIDGLLSAVESELIPRLMLSHFSEINQHLSEPLGNPSSDIHTLDSGFSDQWWNESSIEQFSNWSIEGDFDAMNSIILSLLKNRVGLDIIYLKLISPAARLLGDRWLSDDVSFVDVHVGLLRLHQLVVEFESFNISNVKPLDLRLLLATAPGEQHTLGITMVGDFFRRSGWEVDYCIGMEGSEIVHKVASTSYNCVGFSVNYSSCFDSLRPLIALIRQTIPDKKPLIAVGGNYFVRFPGMHKNLDVDLCLGDAADAVQQITKALPIQYRNTV